MFVAAAGGSKKLVSQAQKVGLTPVSDDFIPEPAANAPKGLDFDPENVSAKRLESIADGNPNWWSMGRTVGGLQHPRSKRG